MANNGIYYSSGNSLNFTTNLTTWATLTSGGTFVINTVSGGTYLNLPSSTFTGGTVTGSTNFTNGLTANTISAATYFNLPVSAVTNGTGISASTSNGSVTITNTAPDQTVTISGGTGITTGGTYPNFTILNSAPDQTVTITGGTNMQIVGTYPNFGINFTGSTGTSGEYLPLSGGTVTGATIFQSGLTANTISAATYLNLPSIGGLEYFVTGATPTATQSGDRWFNTDTGVELVWIEDGDSNQWVQPFSVPGPLSPDVGYYAITGITTGQTLTWDKTYWGISGSSNVDLTLPTTTSKDGYYLIVKDEAGICGTYRIRITPASGLIDGNNYIDMNINYMSLTLMVRGGNWYLI
jgi:hypothetical protein